MIVCISLPMSSYDILTLLPHTGNGILISGLVCMMGTDTPSRFEAPQESWSHFNTDQIWEPDEAQGVLLACTVDIVRFLSKEVCFVYY
jgi:hypothetical protein